MNPFPLLNISPRATDQETEAAYQAVRQHLVQSGAQQDADLLDSLYPAITTASDRVRLFLGMPLEVSLLRLTCHQLRFQKRQPASLTALKAHLQRSLQEPERG